MTKFRERSFLFQLKHSLFKFVIDKRAGGNREKCNFTVEMCGSKTDLWREI